MGFVDCLRDARDSVKAAGLECVLDPRELTAFPAVWLRFDGLAGPVLAGGAAGRSRCLVTVFCVVSSLDPERELDALEPHLEAVAAVIPPHTDPRFVGVLLPGGGQPAPAMTYTHDLLITE